mgnify:CR=1 FL=1
MVRKDGIELLRSAAVPVTLQYGSDTDYKKGDGLRWSYSFWFTFHVLLDHNLEAKEIRRLDVDTSAYWD